ncbi:HAMP domain-containing sensor histidine kinase [Sulfurimonas sp.]|uniref:sensor histidine kinase n=1 Tax=Sulfurimonas sp. TaxID=2022749 RepID=UPI0025E2A74B|nr:HAMP domain-containing sensor histidine kinase [Sulfurimonas sp.]
MFRSLRISIFVYYFLTVSAFLGTLHYFLAVVEVQNIFLLAIVMTCFSILGGVMISKLSIDPLQEHVSNLQNLSKETLHELNLPISTIITNLDMLKKNMENEKDLKRISRIETACSMLKERYNELDYMIKKQTLHEIKEKFMLDELLRQRVKFLLHIYPHIEFSLKLENTEIISDRTGLAKVIDNLIDNAIKYSPNSNLCDIRLNDNKLYIQDYGLGMDEVEIIKIFDNCYQSNGSMRGFGIGLSMVKRFCDIQKIQLNFNSKLGSGTTVLLIFKDNECKTTF